MLAWWPPGVVADASCSLVRVPKSGAGASRTGECRCVHAPQISASPGPPPGGEVRQHREVGVMKQIRERVAGLDVHRDSVVACCRVREPGGEIELSKQRFATTRGGLSELAAFLAEQAVTTVAMEA